ncbi:MAG: PadR family transcriptional regulator [Caldisericia bacterium]
MKEKKGCRSIKVSCFSDIGMSQNFWIKAWFLVTLSKGKSYGYELINSTPKIIPEEKVQSSSIMGNYYRILRALEMNGLVISKWDTSGSGPARRIYSITEKGKEELASIIEYIKQTKEFVDKFFNSIEKEVK